MNRTDLIQATARDIASNVHADPAMRDAMADALIQLCGLMIDAVGKHVAYDGEVAMNGYGCNSPGCDCRANGCDDDRNAGHARYITGERIQEGARWAVGESTNPEVDLDRWTRPTPGDGCRCGHVSSVHEGSVCTGEQFNGEACQGGSCTGFVRREPTGGWQHVDRRPVELRTGRMQVTSPPLTVGRCAFMNGRNRCTKNASHRALNPMDPHSYN